MNFAPYQWAISFYLDLLTKAVFVSFLGLLFTLGGAPVFDFVVGAFFLSLFHFVCLFLGWIVLCLVELTRVQLTDRVRFLVTLISANALFVLSIAAFGSWGSTPNDAISHFHGGLMVGSILATTNVIPIFLAAACGRIFKRQVSPQC
ncbi:hypothetical protein [Bradyrhizobium sp. Tv2a-2]|uniref:hypothetical protein n=1 Tax=Bradyrhizobium sp. Tv2a-2 TaxID=113395 RepID=UPI0003F81F91|nr:hypothetical protein [Bradyrhizobium sp. Tv2a-2]